MARKIKSTSIPVNNFGSDADAGIVIGRFALSSLGKIAITDEKNKLARRLNLHPKQPGILSWQNEKR